MARAIAVLIFVAAGVAWMFGQSPARPVLPGDPLPGLSASEFELFRMGLEDFSEVETAEDGLGPAFNGTSCAVCHSIPAIGGISTMTEVRAGYREEDGTFRELAGGRCTTCSRFRTIDARCRCPRKPM